MLLLECDGDVNSHSSSFPIKLQRCHFINYWWEKIAELHSLRKFRFFFFFSFLIYDVKKSKFYKWADGRINYFTPRNFAYLDGWYFLKYGMKKAKNCTDYLFNLVIQYWQLLVLSCISVLNGDSCLVLFIKF